LLESLFSLCRFTVLKFDAPHIEVQQFSNTQVVTNIHEFNSIHYTLQFILNLFLVPWL